MKSEEVINNWKEQRSRIEVGENFAEGVMNRVYQYERLKRKPLFDVQRFLELISARPLAKAGLITAGAIAGFIRMALTVYMFLVT